MIDILSGSQRLMVGYPQHTVTLGYNEPTKFVCYNQGSL